MQRSSRLTPKVTVVDDSIDMRKLLAEYLGWYGIEVTGFRTVPEALNYLGSEDGSRVDLVLCDLNFPGESGLVLLRELRQLRPAIPVVVMSAFADKAAMERVRSEGAAGYVNKTDGLTRVMDAVESSLQTSFSPDTDGAAPARF
ncbi:MAG: response regulator [Bdellovibrionales bacterium]|nr:response regulator [Bdellovibrionales bacterium]